MRKMSKRISALFLAVLMLFQTCAGNVYAAPLNQGSEITVESEGNFEGTSNETYIEPVTGIEIPDIREEVAQYIDTDILDWVEENIPKDKTKLSKMPQEWWDSLTPSQRKIAEIQLEALDAESNETHYCNQTLQETITILEKGKISAKDFFAGTIIKNITLDDLYRLRDLNISLNELVDTIYGIMEYEGYEMTESEDLFEIAVMASGYSPFTTYASQNPGGEATTGVTRVNTKNTGYTDGRGNSFWHITTTTGQNVYCYKHGASCSRTYTYGNMKQVTGEAAWLIKNYGQATSTTEGYMCYQMAVWALLAGETKASVYDYALGWYLAGGVPARSAAAWAQTVVTFFSMAKGKSGSAYVVYGPSGSQPLVTTAPFPLTPSTELPPAGEPEEEPEPVIVDVPSIDNFYLEKKARTEYHVELTKESIITNETLEGFKFKIVESPASGHDLTYDFITGEYAREGESYEEATIHLDSFGQTITKKDPVPYMDDDIKPSGGNHETTITTNENGYASTTFVHEHTFKEFYSVCLDPYMSEIDYDTYQSMLEEAIDTINGAAGALEIIVNYRGDSATMDAAEALELCEQQQVVYTQTEEEATTTIEELYQAYLKRTYKYTVTELDGYIRKGSTDSNGKVLPEIPLPKDGFRKNVKDATTISSYEKILANGQTMVAGGTNDADGNTEERNITNEPWYNQIFINKTDLETGSQILYDTQFEIYEYYQYKATLVPVDYRLYPANLLKEFMSREGAAFHTDMVTAAKLVIKNSAGTEVLEETLDKARLVEGLNNTSSYSINFHTTSPGAYTAELILTLDDHMAINSALTKEVHNGYIKEIGTCNCTDPCEDVAKADCPVCSVWKEKCTPAGTMKVSRLYSKAVKSVGVTSMDEGNHTFTTEDGITYTFVTTKETSGTEGEADYVETTVTDFTYEDGYGNSHTLNSLTDRASIETIYGEVPEGSPEGTKPPVIGYVFKYLGETETDVFIFDDGTGLTAKDSQREYVKAEEGEYRIWKLSYYTTQPLLSGDYSFESDFSISASSISVKNIDKNVNTDRNDYRTWGQGNYEIVRVTAEIAKKMGWSDTTIGMYTVHRKSALDQYTGTTFTNHHDESDKTVKYGYHEYGTLYYTQANQGLFAIVEKQAPRDGTKTGYLGNFEDRDYTKLSDESAKKNNNGSPYATDDQMSVVKMVHYIDLCTDTNQYATYMLTDGYKEYDKNIYKKYAETIKNDRGQDILTEDGYDAHYFDQSGLHKTIALEKYSLTNPMDDVLNARWDVWFSNYLTNKSGINVNRNSAKTDAFVSENQKTNILHHFVGTTINIDSFNDNASKESNITYEGTYTDTELNYGTFAGEMADALNKRNGFNQVEYLQVGDVTYDNATQEKDARYKNTQVSVNKDAIYAFIDEREYGYIRFTKYDRDAQRYVTGDLDEGYVPGTDHADADLDGAVYSLYVDESNSFEVTYLEGTFGGRLFWAQPLNTGGYRIIYDGDDNAANGFSDRGDNTFEDYAHAYVTKDMKLFLDYNDDQGSGIDVVSKKTVYHGIQHPDGQYGGAKHNGFFAVMEEQQVFVDTNEDGYSDTWTLQDVTLYAGAKVASAVIEDGELEMNGLYLGSYYLAEEIRDAITIYSANNDDVESAENRWLSFAPGYEADTDVNGNPTKYLFQFPYVDKTQGGKDYKAEADYIHKNTHQVSNQQAVKGGSAQFHKITTNGESSSSGNTTGEALEGAGFTVYLLSELSLIVDGTIAPAYGEVDGHELVEDNNLVKLFDAAGNMVGYEFTKSYLREADLYAYFEGKYPEGYNLEDVNRLIFVKDRGYYYVEDILAAYKNAYYDNETKKWDFSGEDRAIVRIYEDDADYILSVNKDYAYVENHLNAGSPCEFYGVNGLSEGWVATGVKNEYRLAEIFSNHYGSVRVPELAWGSYIMVETTTPTDVFTADPVFFSITDTSASANRSKKVTITDTAVVSSLILIKRDAQSGQDVMRAGTSYRIWDYKNHCYVSKYLLGTNGALSVVAQRVFKTDEDGRINAVASLECGKYRIEELSGPNGYHNTYWDYGNGTDNEYLGGIGTDANVPTKDNLFQKYYGTKDFEVTTDRKYRSSGIVSSDNLDYLYIGEYFYNDELQGKLTITKTGEVLVGYKNTDDIEYADEFSKADSRDFNYSKSMGRERSVFESMKDHYDLGTDEVRMRDVVIDDLKVNKIIPISHIAYDEAGMGIATIYSDINGQMFTMNDGKVYQTGVKVTDLEGGVVNYPGAILDTPNDLFVYEKDGKYVAIKAVKQTGTDTYKYYDLSNVEVKDVSVIQSLVEAAEVTLLDGNTIYGPKTSAEEIAKASGPLMIVYENHTDFYEKAKVKAVNDTYIYTVEGKIMDTSYLVTEKDGVLTTNDYGVLKEASNGTYTLTYKEAIYDPDINYTYKMTMSDGSVKRLKLVTGSMYLSSENELIIALQGGGYRIEAVDGSVTDDLKAEITVTGENTGSTFDFVYEERPLADATFVIKAAKDIKTPDNGENYWFKKGDVVATVTTANEGEILSFAPAYNKGGTYDHTYYYGNSNGVYNSLTKEGSYVAADFATTGAVENYWIASRMSALDLSLFGTPAFTDDTIYPNTYYREEVTPIYRRIIREGSTADVIATDYMSRLEAHDGLDSEGAKILTATKDGFMLTNKESITYQGATLKQNADYFLLKARGRSGEDIEIEVKESDTLLRIMESYDTNSPWKAGDLVEKTASGYRISHTEESKAAKNLGAGIDGAKDLGVTTFKTYANATLFDNGNNEFTLYDADLQKIARVSSGILVTQAGGIVTKTNDGYRIDYEVSEELTTNQYVTPQLRVKGATLKIKDQTYLLSWDSGNQTFKSKNGVEVHLSDDYGEVTVKTQNKSESFKAFDLLVEYELHYAVKEDIVRVETDGSLGMVSVYLPLGSYTVEEVKTPYGFLINETVQTVSFEAADQVKEIVFNTKDSSSQYTDQTMKVWKDKALSWFVGGVNTIGEKLDKISDVNFFTWGTHGDAEDAFYKDKEGFINFFDLRVKAWSEEKAPDADNSKVRISKKDITTLEELPGAKLVVTDMDGKEIESWISSDHPHFIAGLQDGDYTLTEVTAPDGYEVAESITFTVSGGEVAGGSVVMYDAPTEKAVYISKQDITNKKELPGAQLVVTDANGKAVDSWTSTKKPHAIENMADGKYTLTEITAPNGYTKTESITFTVKDGVVFGGTVVMYDAPDKKEVYISKQDLTSKEELPGAKLVIYNKDGQIVDSWISTDEVHIVKGLPDGDYTLTEITAPNGYEMAESITFKVVDGQAAGGPVVMYDRISDIPESPEDERHEAPKDHQWKMGVGIYKADKESNASLRGAKFGLYTSDDIYNVDGKLIVSKDTLLAVATTDETGHANFAVDIALMSKDLDTVRADHDLVYEKTVSYKYESLEAVSGDIFILRAADADDVLVVKQADGSFKTATGNICTMDEGEKTVTYTVKESIDGNTAVNTGKFHIKELTPPEGYLYDDTVYDVEFAYDDEYTMYIPVYAKHQNEPTKVTLNKMDLTGQKEVPGATIAVYKIKDVHDVNEDGIISHEDDNLLLIDSWVSTDKPHEVRNLTLSNTEWPRLPNEEDRENIYIFRELVPAKGYIRARDIEFKLYQKTGKDGWIDQATKDPYGYEVMVRMNYCDDQYESGSIISPNEHADSWFINKTQEESTWDYTKVLDGYTEVKWLLVNENLVLFFHENTNKETIDKILREEDFKDLTFQTVFLEFGGKKFDVDFYKDKQVDTRPGDSYLHFDQMWYALNDIHMTMYDDVTKLTFDKRDIVTGEEVIGAALKVIDQNGKVVEEWITKADENGKVIPHYMEGKLTAGEEYTLVETLAPTKDGYVKSNSVKFKVEDDGHIQKVVMQDDFTKLEISKADITTKEEIDGAMLEIWSTDKNGNKLKLVEKWTTGSDGYEKDGKPKRHYMDYLPVGNYVLIETMAPEGYLLAEDVHFTIEETGLLQKVQMLDATKTLTIYKYRTGTTQFVPGATIEIYKVPQEYVSYLTDRVHVELDAAISSDPADDGYTDTPSVKDSMDLAEYLSSVQAESTEHRDVYRSKLTMKYSLAKEDLENNLTLTQTLPKEITLEEADLGKEMVVKDGSDTAFTFELERTDDGDVLKVVFDPAYVAAAGRDKFYFYIIFDGVIAESAVRAGGNILVPMKDGLDLKIDKKDIAEVGSDLTEEVVTIKLTQKDLKATVTTKNGPVKINNLESGWYIALETKAPNGYILDKTPQVFKITNATPEQALTFYNQKKESTPSGGGSSEPEKPTPEEPTPEVPTGGPEIGKLVLRFKNGWKWNNIRTEDTGEIGSSIILTIEDELVLPKVLIPILGAVLLAGGTIFILQRKKKVDSKKAKN